VPIRVELRTESGQVVRDLPDPAGGSFDAAGDFDRLLSDVRGLLRYVDPYGDTVFNRIQMPDLISDVDMLGRREDVKPIESRGLARLRIMAERCRETPHLYVWFIGD
jgi:hypothetical protein